MLALVGAYASNDAARVGETMLDLLLDMLKFNYSVEGEAETKARAEKLYWLVSNDGDRLLNMLQAIELARNVQLFQDNLRQFRENEAALKPSE